MSFAQMAGFPVEFHFQGWHGLIAAALLLLVSLLHDGIRDFLKEKVLDWILKILRLQRISTSQDPAKSEAPDYVTRPEMRQHEAGDQKSFSVLLQAMDQNSRIIQDAAIRVEDAAKESREVGKLMELSMREQRTDFDEKIKDIHEKINRTNESVVALKATNEVVVKLAERSLSQQKTGT